MKLPNDLALVGPALLAGPLGFIIGWEREVHGHLAGTRTFGLVGLGAAVVTSLAATTLVGTDTGRVIAGVLQGIGFIGAGLILRARRVSVCSHCTACP